MSNIYSSAESNLQLDFEENALLVPCFKSKELAPNTRALCHMPRALRSNDHLAKI